MVNAKRGRDWLQEGLFFSFAEVPQIVPFSFEEDINEADYVHITCIVKRGDMPLTISWSLKGDIVSSEPSLNTAQVGPRASVLSIHSVGYRHSGTYTCTARNKAGSASYSAELRVKGNDKMRARREAWRS